MTAIRFRNPEKRLSVALLETASAIDGETITLRELLSRIGEQGVLVLCALLAAPFLLPVSLPFMTAVLGPPMLLIGIAVTVNRVLWLPRRLLERPLPAALLRRSLLRLADLAARVEHLIRPRLLGLTGSAPVNVVHGLALLLSVLLLMAPLFFVPLANTLPGIAIMLLALGMAERDGAVILLGYLFMAISAVYIGILMTLIVMAGMKAGVALEAIRSWIG